VEIEVGELTWVAEIFFPWGDKPCHQICLYYTVMLTDGNQIPPDGNFIGTERIEGRDFEIEFHWIPLGAIVGIEVYPTNAVELLTRLDGGVEHFVYREAAE
jgi:hypothetical protein